MNLRAAGLSDAGRKRGSNQDSFLVLLPPDASSLDGALLVADGMGGHVGGAIASQLAVEAIQQSIATAEASNGPNLELLSKQAVEAANERVFDRASQAQELRGMGTTCTLVLALGGSLYLAHVGDSRAYLIRAGRLLPLTRDHSWVANEVREGRLSEEDAEHDPRKNLLLRAVGSQPTVEIDVSAVRVTVGDRVLLCSDGLSNVLSPEELAAVTVGADGPEQACTELIALANQHGAPDNVTAVVAVVDAADS